MIDTTHESDLYAADFARFCESTGGRTLLTARKAAFDRFQTLGFPTTKHEEWRFTNVAMIAKTAFAPAGRAPADVEPALWPRLVFVNGHFDEPLSTLDGLPPGVRARSLAEALLDEADGVQEHLARHAAYEEQAFVALNTAFMADGACIEVPGGVQVKHPIELLFVATGGPEPVVTHPRNLIVAGPGSGLNIIERYVGNGQGVYFTNAVTEMVVGENAAIDHCKVNQESSQAYHIGTLQLNQDRNSTVTSHTVTVGGALVRNDISTLLDGDGGHCDLNGLYLTSGRQHVDNHLRVEHAKPNCDSREFFKGVLDGQSKAVFTGRIVVHEDAQKTDAKQTNMNLLLSADAQVDTKPQLEILADDVKCTHGATVGQIDEDAVFYLRSRGIDETTARGVLIHAFAQESLDRIGTEPLQRQLREILDERLPYGHLLPEAT
jgi:Fe-S cluster assembly protein SufD